MNIEKYLTKRKSNVDEALDSCLPKSNQPPTIIHKAMRYSVFSGGKRIRPILAIASAECCGGVIDDVLPTACAIEIIHTYSLIHDDLPCMDNADTRRNKPSSHKRFGESIAVLAGDALLTLAFKLLDPRVVKDISEAIGTKGMIGGQALEIQNSKFKIQNLKKINAMKTGALIAASVKSGAVLAEADKNRTEALFTFGKDIGLAFQIVDDIFDREGFALALGRDRAMHLARDLIVKAKRALNRVHCKKDTLFMLADYVVTRTL